MNTIGPPSKKTKWTNVIFIRFEPGGFQVFDYDRVTGPARYLEIDTYGVNARQAHGWFPNLPSNTQILVVNNWRENYYAPLASLGATNFHERVRAVPRGSDPPDFRWVLSEKRRKYIPLQFVNQKDWTTLDPKKLYQIIGTLREFLWHYGVAFDMSFGRMGGALFRSSLSRDYALYLPKQAGKVFRGPRCDVKYTYDETYTGDEWDLNAAYLWGMTVRPLPTKIPNRTLKYLPDSGDGVAHATVKQPPIDPVTQFSVTPTGFTPTLSYRWWDDTVCGWFTFDDLRTVNEAGGQAVIHEAYEATEYISEEDTARFRSRALDLRELPIGKRIVNAVYGSWSYNPGAKWYEFSDDTDPKRKHKFKQESPRRPGGALSRFPMVAHTTARIRRKLFVEALSVGMPILCSTDNVVFHSYDGLLSLVGQEANITTPNGPIGGGVGEWRFIGRRYRLKVGSHQNYVWEDVDGNLRYKWSGERGLPSDWPSRIERMRSGTLTNNWAAQQKALSIYKYNRREDDFRCSNPYHRN